MRELSRSEIDQVSGGVANVIAGAIIGGGGYLVTTGISGDEPTMAGFITATVAGAITSGLSALGGAAVTGAGAIARASHAGAIGVLGEAAAGNMTDEIQEKYAEVYS
jgi:hypothetical protein